MKRSPMPRRTRPIIRTSELRNGSQLERKTGLKPRSKKTEKRYRIRRILVAELLEQRPICERCSREPSSDVHEPRMRSRGADICNPAHCTCLCRPCHIWVHEHPEAATSEGWMVPSWAN